MCVNIQNTGEHFLFLLLDIAPRLATRSDLGAHDGWKATGVMLRVLS